MWFGPFEELVRAQLVIPPDRPLDPDDGLGELGLDSLGTVTLLMELEDAYDVIFPDELLVPATFATAGALWGALRGITAEVGAADAGVAGV